MIPGGLRSGFTVKRQWPLALFALLAMLVSAAVLYAVYSSRTLRGAIPGKAPVLSLASIPAGFIVGTSKAAFSSADGKRWVLEPLLGKQRTVAAGNGVSVYAFSGGKIIATDDLENYRTVPGRISRPIAAAVSRQEEVMVAATAGLYLLERGHARSIDLPGRLENPIAVAFTRQNNSLTVFAAGLTSGVWRQSGPAGKWLRVLRTPVRAVGLDQDRPDNVLVGTSAGVLISTNRGLSWRFTDMRIGVEAIAQRNGEWFAVSEDRLLFQSGDGATGWKSLLQGDAPSL